MTFENQRRSPWTSSAVCSLLLISLAAFGCSAEAGDHGASGHEEVAQVNQDIQDAMIYIYITDDRELRNVRVWLQGRDMFTNRSYVDWEDLPAGPLTKTYDLQWYVGNGSGGNYLSTVSSSEGSRLIRIRDANQYPGTLFTDVDVAVRAEISGSCHYDWERIGTFTSTWLQFNGWNGQWLDNCWRGDLLRSY